MPPCKPDGDNNFHLDQHPQCKDKLFVLNANVEQRSLNNKHTQTGKKDVFEHICTESCQIATDVVSWYVAQDANKTASSKAARAMRRCVTEMLEKHVYRFNGMVNRLGVDESTGYNTFTGVADAVFSDDKVNWGRIVALFAFASRLAQYCKDNGMGHYVSDIAEYLGRYISEELYSWIKEHGGWEEFVKQFPAKGEIDNKIWKGLLATAAVGLGALATIIAAK